MVKNHILFRLRYTYCYLYEKGFNSQNRGRKYCRWPLDVSTHVFTHLINNVKTPTPHKIIISSIISVGINTLFHILPNFSSGKRNKRHYVSRESLSQHSYNPIYIKHQCTALQYPLAIANAVLSQLYISFPFSVFSLSTTDQCDRRIVRQFKLHCRLCMV